MTAHVSSAGSVRRTARCAAGHRGRAERGRRRGGDHPRRRPDRHRRPRDGQVAHVDLMKDWRPDKLRDAVNAHMRPHAVAIRNVSQVSEDFDARFSAIRRRYLYRIVNRRAPLTIDAKRAWLVKRPLDDASHARSRAASSWCATISRPSAIRTVRPRARSGRWSVWTCHARARKSTSTRPRALSCIIRCARWWDRSNMSARENGGRGICAPHWTQEAAPDAAWWRRRPVFT